MSKKQTPIGYLFNGRFYKSIDELRGRTMSADNQPQPLFTESQCKEKVLEALERVEGKLYQEKYNPTEHYLFDAIEITNIIEEVKPNYE